MSSRKAKRALPDETESAAKERVLEYADESAAALEREIQEVELFLQHLKRDEALILEKLKELNESEATPAGAPK